MTNDTTNAMQRFIRDTLADLRTSVNTADVCDGAAAELAYDLANSTDDDDDDDDTSDEENEAQL